MTHPERQPGTWLLPRRPTSPPEKAGLEDAVRLGEAIRVLPTEEAIVTGSFPEVPSPLLGDGS